MSIRKWVAVQLLCSLVAPSARLDPHGGCGLFDACTDAGALEDVGSGRKLPRRGVVEAGAADPE